MEGFGGAEPLGVGQAFQQIALDGFVAFGPQFVDGDQRNAARLDEQVLKFLVADAKEFHHLVVGGRPPQALLQLGIGLFQPGGFLPRRARHPVQRPQLVEDRPFDAEFGVGFELDFARRLEFVDGVHQADDAGVDQVVEFDVRRQAAGDAVGHILDKRQVFQNQGVAPLQIGVLVWAGRGLGIGFRRRRAGFQVLGHRRIRRVQFGARGRRLAPQNHSRRAADRSKTV
ncbi:MAG: hypothetical protein BWZ10_02963 [candidate division BRC1 bacterium ADurb.BinA364]|nr:MAG: hypothetical protein BWZ10_02963 [candidate division BRC1 bacterium ADurb.BinA364]